MVKDFLKRKDFTDSQLDQYINLAKLNIQRNAALHIAVAQTTVTYPTAGGGVSLGNAFREFYGDFAVSFENATGGATPIRGSTFSEEQRRLRADSEAATSVVAKELRYYIRFVNGTPYLFLNPEIADASLKVTYYTWLEDYSSDSDEDVILRIGRDALLWETLKVCNMRLTEEERVKIDDALMKASLVALQDWAARVATAGDSGDLI